jgi:hypothetical protein
MLEQEYELSSWGYLASKPYARPAYEGLTAKRGIIWTGFRNARPAFLYSNDKVVNVPKAAVKGFSYAGNLSAPPFGAPTGNPYAGAAPVQAVYTGVGDY